MSPLYFIIQVVSTFVNAHIPLIKRKKLELFLGKLLTNKNTYGIISPLRKATFNFGGIAQLGERLNGIQEVRGSTPLISTKAKSLDIQGFFYFLLCINAFACLSSHTFFRV